MINKKVMVCHGGLYSKDGVKLRDIKAVDRKREPGDEGLMVESLWSDPTDLPGRRPSKRGVGIMFGPDIAEKFLNDNGLSKYLFGHTFALMLLCFSTFSYACKKPRGQAIGL